MFNTLKNNKEAVGCIQFRSNALQPGNRPTSRFNLRLVDSPAIRNRTRKSRGRNDVRFENVELAACVKKRR